VVTQNDSPTIAVLDKEFEEPPRPYSPSSMVNLLLAHGDTHSHECLKRLGVCMAKQAHNHRTMAREAAKDVKHLEEELSAIRIAEAQSLGNDPPDGYVANDNHLPHFLIPDSAEVYGLVRYVRHSPTNPTLAYGTMGGTNDSVYAITVQAARVASICSQPGPLAAWFLGLLGGPLGPFRLLKKEAQCQADWGLAADI
jgi:hypothetical protein